MADEIKLTLEQQAPQAPSLTLEGVETPSHPGTGAGSTQAGRTGRHLRVG